MLAKDYAKIFWSWTALLTKLPFWAATSFVIGLRVVIFFGASHILLARSSLSLFVYYLYMICCSSWW